MDHYREATMALNQHLSHALPHLLLPVSMILGLASPSFSGRGVFWSSVIVYLASRSLAADFPTDTQFRYALAQSWFWYVPTIQKLLLSAEPANTYWRRDRPQAEAAGMPFGFEKLRWAAALWANPRGIGWNYQIKHVPPAEYRADQKMRFLLRQTLRLLRAYLTVEAAMLYFGTLHFPEALDDITWSKRAVIGLISGCLVYSSWLLQWSFVSILGVAFGLSNPNVRGPSLGHDEAELADFIN
jgi:hypothetical protein